MSTTTPNPTPVPTPIREYDQILSGDVTITKKSNGKHQIKFDSENISDMLIYQTWSDKWPQLNTNREVLTLKATNWVKLNFVDADPNAPVRFQPTCVMELDDGACPFHKGDHEECRHVFVIENAKVKKEKNRKKKNVVFTVSSHDITLPPNSKRKVKLLKKSPTGDFKNVRFDIDSDDDSDGSDCELVDGTMTCIMPAGAVQNRRF